MNFVKPLSVALLVITGLLFTSEVRAEISKADFAKAMKQYLDTDDGKKLLADTIQTYVMAKRQEEAQNEQKKAALELEQQFKTPVKIDAGTSPAKGPADAKVTIIEFSDFQCPFCSKGRATIEEVLKAYPKEVRVVFKNLPLDFHPHAEPAARAALAAGKQGKFWEMHDALFEHQTELGEKFYESQAESLGLDMGKFKKDMSSDEVTKQIESDKKLAGENGIQGTPGFFVNGVAVKGAYPVAHFKMIIDRWLKGGSAKG